MSRRSRRKKSAYFHLVVIVDSHRWEQEKLWVRLDPSYPRAGMYEKRFMRTCSVCGLTSSSILSGLEPRQCAGEPDPVFSARLWANGWELCVCV